MPRRPTPRLAVSIILVLSIVGLPGCPRGALYSEAAYQSAVSLKVDALAVMDLATEPYCRHRDAVDQLQLKIQKAYEYSRGRPDNDLSTRQWAILVDPQRHLLGGFLRDWKEHGPLSAVFVREMKGMVGEAFDEISGLESGKVRPQDLKLTGGT